MLLYNFLFFASRTIQLGFSRCSRIQIIIAVVATAHFRKTLTFLLCAKIIGIPTTSTVLFCKKNARIIHFNSRRRYNFKIQNRKN